MTASRDFLRAYFGDDMTGVYVCDDFGTPQPAKGAKLDPARGWYFCPSRLSGLDARGQRVAENAVTVHALVVDDVGTKIDPDLLVMAGGGTPTSVVETSPGNFQWGYRLPGITPEAFSALRAGLPVRADGSDCVHWFRLPGGVNPKPEHRGFRTRLVALKPGAGDTSWIKPGAPKIRGALGAPGAQASGFAKTATLEDVRKVLSQMPNDDTVDYDQWIAVGHAVYGATGGSEEGRELWEAWSSLQPQERDLEAAWESFRNSKSGFYTLQEIIGGTHGKAVVAGALFDDAVGDGDGDTATPEEMADDMGLMAAVAAGAVMSKQIRYAMDIAAREGWHMRWNTNLRQWVTFGGSTWTVQPVGRKMGFELSAKMARAVRVKVKGDADVTVSGFHDGVEAFCRNDAALQARSSEFNRDGLLVGTPGPTLDLRAGGVLRAARQGDMISKQVATLPSLMAGCPRWKKFIREVTKGDAESEVFLQQWCGYCLTADVSEQKILFLYGPGGNGKSVFCDTVAGVLGDYCTKATQELFIRMRHGIGHSSKLAMLEGARLVVIPEVPADAQWNEALLKEITGGGAITASFKGRDEFTFQPECKLMAYGNHQPMFPGGINEAIRRRFVMMEWDYVPRVKDKDLTLKLRAEWPGILRWMVEGYASWKGTGLIVPQKAQDATDEMFSGQDLIAQWRKDRTEDVTGARTTVSTLFEDWTHWRNAQGEHEQFGNITTFGNEVRRRGWWSKGRGNEGKFYEKVKLRSRAPDVFDDEGVNSKGKPKKP